MAQSTERLEEDKVFNDPVHGHIVLPPVCVRFVNTPQFQRLRHIKQLGAGYHVFPGASHNRFEHSIGVCHLAGEMVATLQGQNDPKLGITERDRLCVMLAGLCHDLGHGPFSHLFESQFMKIVKDGHWEHEDTSERMLDHLLTSNDINLADYGLVPEEDVFFIKELINGPRKGKTGYTSRSKEKEFLFQIVANKSTGLDVDKWDYFARDCHHLGISAMFDHLRLMKLSRVVYDDEDGRWKICYRDKEISNVYDMYQTRQNLHRRAYQHKTVVGIELMISKALLLADEHIQIPDGKGVKRKLSDCSEYPAAYTLLTDSVLTLIALSEQRSNFSDEENQKLAHAQDLLRRIEKRQLYRRVGKTKPKKGEVFSKEHKAQLERDIIARSDGKLDETDVVLSIINLDYGKYKPMKGAKDEATSDPVSGVRFFSKDNKNKAVKIAREQVSHMLPDTFLDQFIQLYCTSLDEGKQKTAADCFKESCKESAISHLVENVSDSEMFP